MNESRILELLTRKLAGEANAAELAELENLLNVYPEAVYYDEALKQLWKNELPDAENIDAAFEKHRLKHQNEFTTEESDLGKGSRIKNIWKYSVLALAACLVIALVTINLNNRHDASEKNTWIFTNKGVRKKIILPDGTQVWLNSESHISFDPDMNDNRCRVISLSGEAFFDVVKDKNRPFIIHTNKISIKVLGTAFNVKAYPEEKNAETTLIHGSIELSVNDRPQQKIILKPLEKFALIEKKEILPGSKTQAVALSPKITLVIENIKPVEIANKTYIEETSWKDNKLVFRNQSLEELAPKFERWFNIHLDIKNQDAKAYRFTGVFTTENLTEALTAMKLIKNFDYKLENNEVIIY